MNEKQQLTPAQALFGTVLVGSSIIGFLVWSTGGILHLLTSIIALQDVGFIGGFVTFLLPVVSEIFWLFRLGFTSNYGLFVLCWTGLLIVSTVVSIGAAAGIAATEKRAEPASDINGGA